MAIERIIPPNASPEVIKEANQEANAALDRIVAALDRIEAMPKEQRQEVASQEIAHMSGKDFDLYGDLDKLKAWFRKLKQEEELGQK